MMLLKSVKSNPPKYSEIFIKAASGAVGPLRLAVDAYNYYVFTSSPEEIAELESLVGEGLDYEYAIYEMIKKYRPLEWPKYEQKLIERQRVNASGNDTFNDYDFARSGNCQG